MKAKLTAISQLRRVFKAAYASLPTAGINDEDLAWATDRLVLYRWNGTAWEAVTIHSSSGAYASIPTAANLPNGSLYFATDTSKLWQVQAGAWADLTPAAGASFDGSITEVFNGTSPTTWTDLDLSGTVGANIAFVMLKMVANNAGNQCAFRRNGDTDEFYGGGGDSGCAAWLPQSAWYGVVLVTTDANGIIEWRANAGVTYVIDVLTFIK